MIVYIYALIDPNTQEVRYIGKSVNPKRRLGDHCNKGMPGNNPHKSRWIAKLRAEGKKPVLMILQECAADTWEDAERHWISHYRSIGAPLTNILSGGISGRDFQPRARKSSIPREKIFSFKPFRVTRKEYEFLDKQGGGTKEGRVLVLREAIAALKRLVLKEQRAAKRAARKANLFDLKMNRLYK